MKRLLRSSFPLPAGLSRVLRLCRLLRLALAVDGPRPVLRPVPIRLDGPAGRPRRPGRLD